MLRVGRIPYLNCEPFFARLDGVELVALNPAPARRGGGGGRARRGRAVPRRWTLPARSRTLDAAALRHRHRPRRAERASSSPSSRSSEPAAGRVIGITPRPSTSVELLRVLLALRYEVERRRVGRRRRALRRRAPDRRSQRSARSPAAPLSRHVTDLGARVDGVDGPAVRVRAVGGEHPGCPSAERRALRHALDRALERGHGGAAGDRRAAARPGLDRRGGRGVPASFNYRLGAATRRRPSRSSSGCARSARSARRC